MSKCITVDDATYKLLLSLKQGPRDSFTKVILRNVYKPLETCGELLDSYESDPPPQKANLDRLNRIERERGRRSGGTEVINLDSSSIPALNVNCLVKALGATLMASALRSTLLSALAAGPCAKHHVSAAT